MPTGPDPIHMTSLGNGDSLHQQVLASFPLSDMTEEDLIRNPQLCKLLATLAQHVDQTGLTVALKSELDKLHKQCLNLSCHPVAFGFCADEVICFMSRQTEHCTTKAEQKLQTQRHHWLHSESLYRGLQEMIQDCCVRKHHTTVPPDQTMFCETVEKCLLVAQCVRMLDPSSSINQDQPSVLGLNPQQVLELMPSEKTVQRMKQSLPRELEKHLKKKCLNLLSYYQPEWENESEGLKSSKLSHLSVLLDKEKKRTESLKETCRENTVLLQRQTQLYLSELIKCVQLLQSLILDHRLKTQTDLDGKKLEYFEGKCELVLQKIKAEMAEIQLDTYTADAISAHRKIRGKLESELKACQVEKQSVELKLASFEILGKDFEALAQEYCKLRQEIEMKNWAVKEFMQYSNK